MPGGSGGAPGVAGEGHEALPATSVSLQKEPDGAEFPWEIKVLRRVDR